MTCHSPTDPLPGAEAVADRQALKTGTDFGIATEKDGRVVPVQPTEARIRGPIDVPAELVTRSEAHGGQVRDQSVDQTLEVRLRRHRLAVGEHAVDRDLVLRDLDDVLAACHADGQLGVTPGRCERCVAGEEHDHIGSLEIREELRGPTRSRSDAVLRVLVAEDSRVTACVEKIAQPCADLDVGRGVADEDGRHITAQQPSRDAGHRELV